MPAKFFWFLPTNGDSRSIVGASHASSHHTIPEGYRAPTRATSLKSAGPQTDWATRASRHRPEPGLLHIGKSIWENESFDFKGDYYTISDGRVSEPPNPLPEFYFGGSSAAALPILRAKGVLAT